MDAGQMGDFEKGNSISFTAERTQARGARRLRQRFLLRRERLLRVLNSMDFLPEHYSVYLDRYGKLQSDIEPKIAWREGKDGKPEFLFKSSFDEMVAAFRKAGISQNIPYDWTIYYLRKKALTDPIKKEELAWVLMQFNQKRGYNQLRGKMDEDENNSPDKGIEKEYHELQIIKIDETEEKDKKGWSWYNITLDNGWVYRRVFQSKPDWEGKTRAFIASFKLDKEGKRVNQQPSLSSPKESDWGLYKTKTQHQIDHSGFTVGEYIFNLLLQNPNQKIIGETVRTIDRHYYYDELKLILKKQSEYIPELLDCDLYHKCVETLYPNNETHRNIIAKRTFVELFVDDILFYQRPLKSKKTLIANCPFESHGEWPIKCIAKSHPSFQEFRIWQFISNLRILHLNEDVTKHLLPSDDAYTDLYDSLSKLKSIKQEQLLKHFRIDKKKQSEYRWNYVPDKEYPMGETRAVLLGGLRKAGIDLSFLYKDNNEFTLWHILYSIDDTIQYEKALKKFAGKQDAWTDVQKQAFSQAFRKLTVCGEKDYGAYSEKAIKRLLPLMRRGQYWSADAIDRETRSRIDHIISGEADDTISSTVREKFAFINDISLCKGLNTWEACYLVYDRHSEAIDAQKWTRPEDIDRYLSQFRQHSLNNPIVEQIVTEALRVVRDIWNQTGRIDEIHIELGRELKKTKEERERMTASATKAEADNQRIRLLLCEMKNPDMQIANVRPYSPSQYEILKIYEDGVFNQPENIIFKDDIERKEIESIRDHFTATKVPSHAEVIRYKLWLDQKYISPYTGKPIPLSLLFTDAYQIEHIIPRSIWFDDSFANKVICETEVNSLKDRQLGHQFIVNHHGEKVKLISSGEAEILSVIEYEKIVRELFGGNSNKTCSNTKYNYLMLDEIPENFINRQLNDSRYISRLMMHLLSNIVRTEDENGNNENATTSKNVIACNGKITDRLKQDWGVNDVWNRILLPRFERMNDITHSSSFTAKTKEGHFIPAVPLEIRKGFNKKRLDHRHHAMDAIVIACCTRDHVNLINNEAADHNTRYDLQNKLRNKEKYTNKKKGVIHERFTTFKLPWDTFPADVYSTLQNIIVSFKQNLRVINKTSNYYAYDPRTKKRRKQERGDSWAIRKALHKETVFGEVNLQLKKKVQIMEALKDPDRIVNRELKDKIKEKKGLRYTDKRIIEFLSKNKDIWSEAADGRIEVYYYTKETKSRYFATRKGLLSVMAGCTTVPAAEKAIDSITDSGIRSILRAHLASERNNPEEAFSADGLERMNANIRSLNGGRDHQPIKRVRVYEQANKFSIGQSGQKATKFVEAAKGTNLFYAIYSTDKGLRGYATIPLNIVIDLQKQYLTSWKDHIVERLSQDDLSLMPADAKLLYVLSPNDLVYVPVENEVVSIDKLDRNRIYKVVSFTGSQFMCVSHRVASPIENKKEYTTSNKMERATTGEMIKEVCIPIKVDRLGNIVSGD